MTSDGIAVDPSSNILVATHDSHVWRISPAGVAAVVAGNGFSAYTGDGAPAMAAQFGPSCVAVDRAQNIYIADQAANVVRKFSGSGIITTVAGTGQPGNSGDGGPAVKAQLTPSCVSVDKAGNLYIPDSTPQRCPKGVGLGWHDHDPGGKRLVRNRGRRRARPCRRNWNRR